MKKLAHLSLWCVLLASASACGSATVDLPEDPAERFCFEYERTCGFNNSFGGAPYADTEDCVSAFRDFNAARQDCVNEHLSFAMEGDAQTQCPRAEGGEPCDPDPTFCTHYDTICGFGNDRGGEAYLDQEDCLTRIGTYEAERRQCIDDHLGFAEEGDPDLHCPHVEGAPPCD